jgi:SPP1 family predicted phage head-tail adaptor
MANVNDLKTRVEIHKYSESENEGGTPIEKPVLYKKAYSGVRVMSGGTQNDGLGNLPYSNVEFILRYDKNIDYKCQVKYNNVFYKINHIELLDRNSFMKLQTVVYNELM